VTSSPLLPLLALLLLWLMAEMELILRLVYILLISINSHTASMCQLHPVGSELLSTLCVCVFTHM
jgi:hypothetical protein